MLKFVGELHHLSALNSEQVHQSVQRCAKFVSAFSTLSHLILRTVTNSKMSFRISKSSENRKSWNLSSKMRRYKSKEVELVIRYFWLKRAGSILGRDAEKAYGRKLEYKTLSSSLALSSILSLSICFLLPFSRLPFEFFYAFSQRSTYRNASLFSLSNLVTRSKDFYFQSDWRAKTLALVFTHKTTSIHLSLNIKT